MVKARDENNVEQHMPQYNLYDVVQTYDESESSILHNYTCTRKLDMHFQHNLVAGTADKVWRPQKEDG